MMQLTIIGFGNQAKAWALNLKDSGWSIRIAIRPGSPSVEKILDSGLNYVFTNDDDFYNDQFYALLTPDHTHFDFIEEHSLKFHANTTIIYAHGFSVVKNHFPQKYTHLQHLLMAPKAIASELRNQYLCKGEIGGVFSVEYAKDSSPNAREWLLKLSHDLGITLGPFEVSFKQETMADLFSEQTLLCSIIPFTAHEIFQKLTSSGIPKELAYLECWHEIKLIVDVMIEIGPEKFFDLISPNALLGAQKGRNTLMSPSFLNGLDLIFQDIQSGNFDKEIDQSDIETTRKNMNEFWKNSPLQQTFESLRRMKK
jgi:ketol-acid reductoisomerase